ncbi:MAG: histidine phosphotransferase family protein [Pseudomonadota bacterium]
MTSFTEPTAMELASLIVSKTCHDIISPVGASSSAMEMWSTASDEGTRQVAQNLMEKSSVQAVKKLTFVRIAYGAYGDVGGDIDLGEAQEAAVPYLTDDRTSVEWTLERLIVPKTTAKLILGLLALTKDALPRGGTILVSGSDLTGAAKLMIEASGPKVIIPQGAPDALSRTFADGVHARNVHLYHLVKMADAVGVEIKPEATEEKLTLTTQ